MDPRPRTMGAVLHWRRRRGFSIAEALMASVILAVAVVGIAGPLGAASAQAQQSRENAVALALARELMEEIASKPLWDGGTSCSPGPELARGENSRGRFDSADDYAGYRDVTSDLKTLGGQGVSIDRGGSYAREVSFEYRATPAGAASASGDFGLVTITVTTPGKQVVRISRLLSRFSLSL